MSRVRCESEIVAALAPGNGGDGVAAVAPNNGLLWRMKKTLLNRAAAILLHTGACCPPRPANAQISISSVALLSLQPTWGVVVCIVSVMRLLRLPRCLPHVRFMGPVKLPRLLKETMLLFSLCTSAVAVGKSGCSGQNPPCRAPRTSGYTGALAKGARTQRSTSVSAFLAASQRCSAPFCFRDGTHQCIECHGWYCLEEHIPRARAFGEADLCTSCVVVGG